MAAIFTFSQSSMAQKIFIEVQQFLRYAGTEQENETEKSSNQPYKIEKNGAGIENQIKITI